MKAHIRLLASLIFALVYCDKQPGPVTFALEARNAEMVSYRITAATEHGKIGFTTTSSQTEFTITGKIGAKMNLAVVAIDSMGNESVKADTIITVPAI